MFSCSMSDSLKRSNDGPTDPLEETAKKLKTLESKAEIPEQFLCVGCQSKKKYCFIFYYVHFFTFFLGAVKNIVFLPCSHVAFCSSCQQDFAQTAKDDIDKYRCPICRTHPYLCMEIYF